jgi:hypothetical protein
LAKTVQVPSAKWQSAKVFVDDIKECACRRDSECDLWRISPFGVVGRFQLKAVSIAYRWDIF